GALDGRLQDDSAAARHELAHPGELAGFRIALVLGAGVTDAEHLLDLVAVEQFHGFPESAQAVGEALRERRLACPAHAGQPDRKAARRSPEIHRFTMLRVEKDGAQYSPRLSLARNMLYTFFRARFQVLFLQRKRAVPGPR